MWGEEPGSYPWLFSSYIMLGVAQSQHVGVSSGVISQKYAIVHMCHNIYLCHRKLKL